MRDDQGLENTIITFISIIGTSTPTASHCQYCSDCSQLKNYLLHSHFDKTDTDSIILDIQSFNVNSESPILIESTPGAVILGQW